MTHKPCPECVRACIEALRDRDADRCFITALEALLPDRAEELVREHLWRIGADFDSPCAENCRHFIKDLLQNYTLEKK